MKSLKETNEIICSLWRNKTKQNEVRRRGGEVLQVLEQSSPHSLWRDQGGAGIAAWPMEMSVMESVQGTMLL